MMKITKRQLKRIIREEKRRLHELGISRGERDPDHGLEVPVPPPDVETLWGDVEGALGQLTTALSQLEDLDPQAASEAATYVAEEIHSWR
tara:strand:- start:167 stop:436 length:270 start_codon:yes stop_codon:yes gene_type:complete